LKSVAATPASPLFHSFKQATQASRLHYLLEFSRSVINWSLVVMTLLAAENPVDATIMLMNSFDRSTLLSSNAPARIAPAVSVSGPVIFATPLFAPVVYMLPPLSTRPCGLSNVATATCPRLLVRPLSNAPVMTPLLPTEKFVGVRIEKPSRLLQQ